MTLNHHTRFLLCLPGLIRPPPGFWFLCLALRVLSQPSVETITPEVQSWIDATQRALSGTKEAAFVRAFASRPANLPAWWVSDFRHEPILRGWTNSLVQRHRMGWLVPQSTNHSGRRGARELATACRIGSVETLRLLLNMGADPNEIPRTPTGGPDDSVLQEFVQNPNHPRNALRRFGMRPGSNRPPPDPETKRACLDLLLAHGAVLEPRTPEKSEFSFRRFPPFGRFDVVWVDYVLLHSPSAATDGRGDNLLHHAAAQHRALLIPKLCQRGADFTTTNRAGLTPLQLLASSGGRDPALRAAAANTRGSLSSLPDWQAEHSNRLATAQALLAAGARHDVFSAAGLDDTNHLLHLVRKDPGCVLRRDRHRQTPLHWAVKNGCTAAISVLLNSGAEVGPVDLEGNTPLHLAMGWSPNSIIPVLIQHGAPLEATNAARQTPAAMAALGGGANLKALLQAGAKIEPEGSAIRPLLASLSGPLSRESLTALIEAGASLDRLSPDGLPLLHHLVCCSRMRCTFVDVPWGFWLDATREHTPMGL